MAHINANQHRTHPVHSLWELQVEQITRDLGVDLSQHIGCLRKIELVGISGCDDLGGDLELVEQALVHLVVVLVAKDYYDHLRVPEDTLGAGHHVVKQLRLDLVVVRLVLDLNEVWLLNLDLELATGLQEVVVDLVCRLEVGALA